MYFLKGGQSSQYLFLCAYVVKLPRNAVTVSTQDIKDFPGQFQEADFLDILKIDVCCFALIRQKITAFMFFSFKLILTSSPSLGIVIW
jgi:hypothetical protein